MENIKYLLISILVCVLLSGTAQSSENVTILESTESSIHFIVKTNLSKLNSKMMPDLTINYFQTLSIGIPTGSNVNLNSAAGLSRMEQTSVSNLFDKRIHKTGLVKITDPVSYRGKQIVNLIICPVRNGFVYEEIEVQLSFENQLNKSELVFQDDSLFNRMIKSSIINFDKFQKWPKRVESKKSYASSAMATPFANETDWFKVYVSQTGLYRITGQDLITAGYDQDINSNSIHLFNGGGLPLPVDNLTERPEMVEIALIVDDGGDGRIDVDDEILFYGESVNRWLFSPDSFVNNAYAKFNIYWLTVSDNLGAPLRVEDVDGSLTGTVDTTISSFRKRLHTEQNNLLRKFNGNEIYDYYRWYWTDQSSLQLFVTTPNINIANEVDIFLSGRTFGIGGVSGYMDIEINGQSGISKICNTSNCTYTSSAFRSGLNEIDLSFEKYSTVSPYFDYIDIEYTSYLVPVKNELDITVGFFDGRARFDIVDNISFPPLLLDVSNPTRPVSVSGFSRSNSSISFEYDLLSGQFNRFYLNSAQNAFSPGSIEKITVTNLKDNLTQTDLFIITPEEFSSAMDEYVEFREAEGYKIKLVTIEDIMDNFSYGLYDPTAIRDFLKFAYENYPIPAPTYVLFVGDGSYDFLDIMETGIKNYVPPYVNPYDVEQFYSDDNYLYFGRYGIIDSDTTYDSSLASFDRGFDMISARWPVKSIAEISTVIAKIKRYESDENFGEWRTNITIVADDEFTTNTYLESIHTLQAEELEREHIPAVFNRQKIYLWDYPFVNRYKPEVNDEIVKAFNEGSLLINYVGHGNPDLWAHEHVFTRNDDLPRLNNTELLPLVFTASCEIAFFDNPKREGMAEDLFVMPNGGSIGVVSATRRVYSGPNAEFNRHVFDILLYEKELTICEAVYTAKIQRQYKTNPPSREDNDQAYLLFGDPLLKLAIPQFEVEFTNKPDSLIALQPITVAGRVLDKNGNLVNQNGSVDINIYDSERNKRHFILDLNGIPRDTISYKENGPVIFKGSASIVAGLFEFTFIPPIDIGYGGNGAKISAYVKMTSSDGTGVIDSLPVASTIAASTDSIGPAISYKFINRSDFISGDYINNNESIEIFVSDSSGINLTGGLGHGITLEIDNDNANLITLSDKFEFTLNDYTSGKLVYNFENLTPGEHSIKIKAWDNANNSKSVEFTAIVVLSERLAIEDLLNYPNPMQDSTRFSFILTQPVSKMTVEIYTLSGRKIHSLVDNNRRDPGYYNDIIWYGNDFDYSPVATGVYIFKAVATPEDEGEIAEQFGKLVVIN
ncbi:MAG: hypothetical protein DRP35_06725 [Candidatus Zixiibacteriota bacterium]|nr:MAG: hypothetical protein DRP35_06725 [candidate division Zixibacteria bacterium]